MNKLADKIKSGKMAELKVMYKLLRSGIDVYPPLVDDKGIDFIARIETDNRTEYFEFQVKSVKGYNLHLGVKEEYFKRENIILVLCYMHENKPDEFFFQTAQQVRDHIAGLGYKWGDYPFKKKEREKFKHQNLETLPDYLFKQL